jgi:hypothetical protein
VDAPDQLAGKPPITGKYPHSARDCTITITFATANLYQSLPFEIRQIASLGSS